MNYQWRLCPMAGSIASGFEKREISSSPTSRGEIPHDILCLPLVSSWMDRFKELLADHLTDNTVAELRDHSPKYIVPDDLTWIDDVITFVTGQYSDIKMIATDRIFDEYRAIQAAHATRTDNLEPYYRDGLLWLRPEIIEEKARRIFIQGDDARATEERLQNIIFEERLSNGRAGELHFSTDERSLITKAGGSGHYLIYGSEYLLALGAHLTDRHTAQNALKRIGRPTMFVCNVPLAMIPRSFIEDFAAKMIVQILKEFVGERESAGIIESGGFRLTADLPTECILGHYYPEMVYDPYGGG